MLFGARCQVFSEPTEDFPGGVPVRESCVDPANNFDNTPWYFGALWLYYGIKWVLVVIAGRLGYRYKREFRIGSAAFAGAHEIQLAALSGWNLAVHGSIDPASDYKVGKAAANWLTLWSLMLIGGLFQYKYLKDLETAVDQAESAGRARAKLRITIQSLQRDIQELRANAESEKRALKTAGGGEEEIDSEIKMIDQITEGQIKTIKVQLDSLKVSTKLAEEKVISRLLSASSHLPHPYPALPGLLRVSLPSRLTRTAQFLVKYAAMEKQDESHKKTLNLRPFSYLLIPMRKLDNAVLYASYSGFYTAFINKWQKRADTLAQFDMDEIKGLTAEVADYAKRLEEPEAFASLGGLSFMETDLFQGMAKKAETLAKDKGIPYAMKFLKDRLEMKVCEVMDSQYT